ncbi:MAG: polyprenyl synthetase family protein [Candidatus Bathyarchaeia archaeon]
MNGFEKLIEIGRKVDPILIHYLEKNADEAFAPIVKHQILAGGKRVRAVLTLISCKAVGGKIENGFLPAAIVELIHNYSLIMDDIIDKGEIRRGSQTVRAKYGDVLAILAGMFYREVIADMIKDCKNSKKINELVIEAIKETIDGERLDILFEQAGRLDRYIIEHRYEHIPLKLYYKMIGKKTATLIRSSCIAGAIAANASKRDLKMLSEFGWKIGLAFQLMDDLLDIYGEKTGKQKGKDIIEHKLGNIIILHAIEEMDDENKKELLGILKSEIVSNEKLKLALELIDKTNAKNKTLNEAQKLIESAKKTISRLKESKAKNQLIEIADFIVKRAY